MGARFWISTAVLFVVSMLIGFIVHGFLMHGDYAQLPNLLRTESEAQAFFGWMLLAHVLMAAGMTWVYRKGREASRPFLGQGLRFGVAMSVLITVPIYLIYYAIQPWPGMVVVKQIVFDIAGMLILGVAAAAINQDTK